MYMYKTGHFWAKRDLLLMVALILTLLVPYGRAGVAAESRSIQHFKMLSTVEYSGKTQFKSQVETLMTVKKQFGTGDKIQYSVSSDNFDLLTGSLNRSRQESFGELSFVIDVQTGYLSGAGKEITLLEKINNQCVKSLKKVTRENIGKTWKQSFKMPFLEHLLPGELKLTLTAVKLETKAFGEMIAVRALSEPFIVKAAKANGGVGDVKSKIGTVYLFDSGLEDIYLSVSVFEATTKINGFVEKLRHEIATYKTDADGMSVDLNGLGKEFEKLVAKVGLSRKSLKVVNKGPLPQWARSEGLGAAQVANICAATACEGALNPVATIYMPATRTVALQSFGTLTSIGKVGAVSSSLAAGVTGVGGMKIAAAPAFMGMSLGTAGAVAGGAIAIAVGAGGGGSGSSQSPNTP